MKSTYLIPTIKPSFCVNSIIKQIESLGNHDYEIIIISSNQIISENPNVKFVFDDKNTGSVYAINKGYKESNGDVIFLMTDDHSIPANLLSIFDYFETPEFKNKKAKIANLTSALGGPGYFMYHKDPRFRNMERVWALYDNIQPNSIMGAGPFPIDFQYAKKYNTICFPVFFRETIENLLGGVIYNERFEQCYADHWLGFYCDNFLDKENLNWGPKDIWVDVIPDFSILMERHERAELDKVTFLELVKNLAEGKSTTYNS